MQESIDLIEQRARRGRDAFLQDDVLRDAILRRLETLTDAAGQLSAELKARHLDVRWRDITAFRNRVAHGYLHIDLDRVWEIIETDLPNLRSVIETELNDHTDGDR